MIYPEVKVDWLLVRIDHKVCDIVVSFIKYLSGTSYKETRVIEVDFRGKVRLVIEKGDIRGGKVEHTCLRVVDLDIRTSSVEFEVACFFRF